MESVVQALALVGEALGIRNLDPDGGLVFITGGTGVVGHRIVQKFIQAGYTRIRAVAHSPAKVQGLKEVGVRDVAQDFCWNEPNTYARALKGVKTVICTPPNTKDWNQHFECFVEACIKAGVKHFIKLSFYHARSACSEKDKKLLKDVPLIRHHGECDELLVANLTPQLVEVMTGDPVDVFMDVAPRMSYTLLHSTFFMSNPLTIYHHKLHDGDNLFKNQQPLATFYGSSGNQPINYVSPNDIAEVAVRVALSPREHYNKEYNLTGPESITDQQVASLFGKHLNRPVMYVDQSPHELARRLGASGDADWHISDLMALERLKKYQATRVDHDEGEDENDHGNSNETRPHCVNQRQRTKKPLIVATEEIASICGRPAQTFEEYLNARDMMSPLEKGAD